MKNMKRFRIISRILFVVLPLTLFPSMAFIMENATSLPLFIGIGFLMMSFAFYMVGTMYIKTGFEKFDRIVYRTSFIMALITILSTSIAYDKDITMYENENGYEIETGTYTNDSIPISFMVNVYSTSVILSGHKHFVTFCEGSWFFHVGRIADVNKFGIEVKEKKYLTGTRTNVTFYYNGNKLDHYNTKFY